MCYAPRSKNLAVAMYTFYLFVLCHFQYVKQTFSQTLKKVLLFRPFSDYGSVELD